MKYNLASWYWSSALSGLRAMACFRDSLAASSILKLM